MFIQPNEFEQLLSAKMEVRADTRLRLSIGSLILIVLVPAMLAWWIIMAFFAACLATCRFVRECGRLTRQAAEYAGMLVVG